MEIGRIFRELMFGQDPPAKLEPKIEAENDAPHQPVTGREATEAIQKLIDACLEDAAGRVQGFGHETPDFRSVPAFQRLVAAPVEQQMAAAPLVLERLARRAGIRSYTPQYFAQQAALQFVADRLLSRQQAYPEEALARMLRCAADWTERDRKARSSLAFPDDLPMGRLLTLVERAYGDGTVPEGISEQLRRLRPRGGELTGDDRKAQLRIERLCGVASAVLPLGGEPWADALREEFQQASPELRAGWEALLAHAATAVDSKPTAKWMKAAAPLVAAFPPGTFPELARRWFALVREPRTAAPEGWKTWFGDWTLHLVEPNVVLLRGLVWCCAASGDVTLASALGDLAEVCFKKIREVGPRCERVGNACIFALGALGGPEAVAQLTRLRARGGQGKVRGAVEKALEAAAAKAGCTAADLEEMAVPTAGLDAEGTLRREIGGYTAEIRMSGREVALQWLNPEGQPLKSAPATLRRDHAADVKAAQTTARDLEKVAAAQCDRIERLLRTERSWQYATWRERYLEHPLVGTLARRLIWVFGTGDSAVLGTWHGGRLVDVELRPLTGLDDATEVRLWHPLGFSPETVLRWRELLEREGIRQPFKQAHREIYLLTDAELRTRTYSNRFAAHVLRQHQFRALCGHRGWSYQLQGQWDGADGPASLPLPEWGLRAELWIDYVHSSGVSDMGILIQVGTDQVRFSGRDGAPLVLTEVPALVFSEVMRDVDLFVGVASIAADPNWRDSGEQGHRDYWQQQAFGELSGSAETRRDVLSRLIPRLKIRDRCTLEGRFLRVRGDLREYKIHLGSGNILMAPNDQYLCIVPDRRADNAAGGVFLPFEGDTMLSLILSKAFLLAEDIKIKDPSIVSQISVGRGIMAAMRQLGP